MSFRKVILEIIELQLNKGLKEVIFSIERKQVRLAVFEHSVILERKFPGINLNEVVISVQTMLRNAIDTSIAGRDCRWTNSRRTSLQCGSIGILRRLMTVVKQKIRQTARESINTTKRKLNSEEASTASAALVITGTDIRNKSRGGDITVKTDLKKGVIVKSAQDFSKDTKLGIQIGQVFGSGISAKDANDLVDFFEDKSINAEISEIKKEAIKVKARIDLNLSLFNKASRKEGSLLVTIVESAKSTRSRGGRVGLKKLIDLKLVELRKELKKDPVLLNRYKDGIVELFKTGKVKKANRKTTKVSKINASVNKETKVFAPTFNTTKENARTKSDSTSISNIIKLVNDRFAEQIKKNMGTGSSKSILNWQTGRFGRSAEVTGLNPRKSILDAKVKYFGFPYVVFEKGSTSPLFKQGRRPDLIFGKSIRQILQEEKLGTFRRVNVSLERTNG